jgi:hypothetical protein
VPIGATFQVSNQKALKTESDEGIVTSVQRKTVRIYFQRPPAIFSTPKEPKIGVRKVSMEALARC